MEVSQRCTLDEPVSELGNSDPQKMDHVEKTMTGRRFDILLFEKWDNCGVV